MLRDRAFYLNQTHCYRSFSLNKNIGEKFRKNWLWRDHVMILFSVGIINNILLYLPIVLKVPIEKCPIGFSLTTLPSYICTCHPKLVSIKIHACEIVNRTGWNYRVETMWVSASFSPHDTISSAAHQYCPYNYCKTDNVSEPLIV